MDKLTPERRSRNMQRIRSKDTEPELLLRSLLHGLGYRFRLHRPDLPGKPDIVFPGRHKAVFMHGCFWHQHSECSEGRIPASRREYWEPKLARTKARDAAALRALRKAGWRVRVVWQCELERNAARQLRRLVRFLEY